MTDLTIGGDTFAATVTGDAARPVLMLAHALGTDHRMWDGQVAPLERHFRLVRYDVRGHGGSTRGAAPLSIERLGRDALTILDALDIPRAHWLGLSMGGAIGLWLLAHAPERIDRAIIANSAPRIGTPDGWNERILSARTEGMAKIADATLARWFGDAFAARAPRRIAPIRDMLHAMDPTHYAAACAALRDTDLRQAIRAIRHDVLVIHGRDDATVSRAEAEALARTMPGGRMVELDARHMSNIEAEADFNAAVVAFLTTKRLPRTEAAAQDAAKKGAAKKGATKKAPTAERGGARRRSNAARSPLKTTPARPTAATRKTSAAAAGPATKKVGDKTSARRAAQVQPPRTRSGKAAAKASARAPAKAVAPRQSSSRRKTPVAKMREAMALPAKKANISKTRRPAAKTTAKKTASKKPAAKRPATKRPAAKRPAAKRMSTPTPPAKTTPPPKARPATRRTPAKKPRRPTGRRKT